ncbi:MAG: dephospho-CoA kinase [Aquificaceae bacterium]|nr:dephospho-CoA kinase [Aquificaceae bacterium]
MKDWRNYKARIDELMNVLDSTISGIDIDYELKTPEDEDFDPSLRVPYILLKYYADEEHEYERKIELFEYYFDKPTQETAKLITDMVEEFLMEIDQSLYGGG